MDVTFESEQELYNRVKPALSAKKEEMRRKGYDYIREEDIWNYLKEVEWVRSKNLYLYEMIQDVLHAENELIDRYLRNKLNMNQRTVYFNEE